MLRFHKLMIYEEKELEICKGTIYTRTHTHSIQESSLNVLAILLFRVSVYDDRFISVCIVWCFVHGWLWVCVWYLFPLLFWWWLLDTFVLASMPLDHQTVCGVTMCVCVQFDDFQQCFVSFGFFILPFGQNETLDGNVYTKSSHKPPRQDTAHSSVRKLAHTHRGQRHSERESTLTSNVCFNSMSAQLQLNWCCVGVILRFIQLLFCFFFLSANLLVWTMMIPMTYKDDRII